MKTIVLIAVRMKSTRLPKKALAEIEGKPLINHLIERLKTAKVPASLVLCTSTHQDDSVLVEIAKKAGVKWFGGSEDDVLERFIRAAESEGADNIVRATGDNPLTDPEYIDKAITKHVAAKADYTFVEGLPKGTECEVISVKALKKCKSSADNPEMSEYMTLYFKNSGLFKTEKITAAPEVNRPQYRLTVDAPEDLKLVREIYGRLYRGGRVFPLSDVVKFLDDNPKLGEMNANIKPKEVKMQFVKGKMRIVEGK